MPVFDAMSFNIAQLQSQHVPKGITLKLHQSLSIISALEAEIPLQKPTEL